MTDFVAGRHPVLEALKSGSRVHQVLVAEGAEKGSMLEITTQARKSGIPVREVARNHLDALAGGLNHQGVVALMPAKEYVQVDDLLTRAREKGEDPFILVLDKIEDPHNFGAILRTAEAVGVHGVIIPKHRAVGLTPAVARASAGAVAHVPVARVANLVQAVEKLKTEGCWIVAADLGGGLIWQQNNLSGPLACIIGSEGKGIARLLKDKSDILVRIPMKGRLASLNASVAAAVLCYEILRQREKKQGKG